MTKTIRFSVEITFADYVKNDDKEVVEVGQKIVDALVSHVDHSENGLAPDDSETFVEHIRVDANGIKTIIHSF